MIWGLAIFVVCCAIQVDGHQQQGEQSEAETSMIMASIGTAVIAIIVLSELSARLSSHYG